MANIKIAKVSSKGQIVIPEELREELGLKQGTNLVLVRKNSTILIMKAEELADSMKDLLKYTEVSLRDLWDRKEEDVWNEYLK